MKYAVFAVMLVAGVPALAALASAAPRWRQLLCAALVVSPLVSELAGINFVSTESYRGADRGFEITLTDLLALALLIALLVRFARRVSWWPAGSTPMLLFFALACVSARGAAAPLLASFTLLKMVRVYLLFWTLTNLLRVGVPAEALYQGLVAVGLIFGGYAVKQKYLDGLYRIHGPFDHSNTIPLYLNAVMPLTLMWSLAQPALAGRWAALGVVAALAMIFAVVATFSRVGQALAAGSLLAVLGLALARARSRRVTRVAAVVALIAVAGGIKAAPSIMRRLAEAPQSSEEARHEFNIAARMMARDHALGVGPNNFSHVLTNEERYREHITVMANEEQAGVAHHIYWLTAAELGWVGLAAYLLVMLRLLLLALRHGIRARTTPELLLLGLAFGAITMHVTGFFEWAFRITPVTYQFAIVAASTVGLAEQARAARAAAPDEEAPR